MPTQMFKDANKLCLDELCRAISFSGGFLGNKDDPLNAKPVFYVIHHKARSVLSLNSPYL